MAAATATALRMEDRIPVDVLVVSPNTKLRDELMEKLCLPRWRVGEANGGAEALMRLREHGGNDAVLLLDPVLPDLDTGEFHRIVRDRFPSTQVLMLNSHTGQLLLELGVLLQQARNVGCVRAALARSTARLLGSFELEQGLRRQRPSHVLSSKCASRLAFLAICFGPAAQQGGRLCFLTAGHRFCGRGQHGASVKTVCFLVRFKPASAAAWHGSPGVSYGCGLQPATVSTRRRDRRQRQRQIGQRHLRCPAHRAGCG